MGITSARPPRDGYVIQTSNSVTGSSDAEVALKYNPGSVTMANLGEVRNFSFIREANYDGGSTHFTTEVPHNLMVGSKVKINNVTSTAIQLVLATLSTTVHSQFLVSLVRILSPLRTLSPILEHSPTILQQEQQALPTFQKVRAQ